MWNRKSLFMYLRIKVTTGKRSVRVRLIMALYALHQLFLSFEGLLLLVPGKHGIFIRTGVDTVHSFLLALIAAPPEEYVNVNMENDEGTVLVSLKSMGYGS